MPGVIGIGPPRTGTTWMHTILQGHVGLPRVKETNFFSSNYDLGLDWYRSHFRHCAPGAVIGEIDPLYFDVPEAPTRIARHIPNGKIFCSLRDPVQRLYSQYRLLRSLGWKIEERFDEAVASWSTWADAPGNMVGVNRYAFHLKRWLAALGKENILVTFYCDLEANPQQYLDRITDYFGINRIDVARAGAKLVNPAPRAPLHPALAGWARFPLNALKRWGMWRTHRLLKLIRNACSAGGEKFGPLDPKIEARLREKFRPEVEELEELTGRDLSAWKGKA